MASKMEEKLKEAGENKWSLAQAFRIDAKEVAALLQTGYTLYEQGRLEGAKNIFEGLVALDVRNPYLHGILGTIYQKQNKQDMALACYSMALTLFPEDISSLVNRGEVYLKLGRFEEAAADLKKAIDLDSKSKHPAANRARLLVGLTLEALHSAKQKGLDAKAPRKN